MMEGPTIPFLSDEPHGEYTRLAIGEEAGAALGTSRLGCSGKRLGSLGEIQALQQSHWLQSSVIIFGVVFGTGALDLPRAFANLGWVSGVASLVAFGLLARYAGGLLYRVKSEFFPMAMSYAQAAEVSVGPRFSQAVACLVMANWFLILPYYLVGASTAMVAACSDASGPLAQLGTHHWILLLALPLTILLQNPTLHSIRFVAALSNAAMLGACGIAVVSMLAGGVAPDTTHHVGPPATDFLTAYSYMSSLIFAYQGHDMYYEIIREMEVPTEFPRSLGVANNLMIVAYLLLCGVTYAIKGDATPSFLIDAIPHSSLRTAAGLLLVGHILVTYLLVNQPLSEKIHRRLVVWARARRQATCSNVRGGSSLHGTQPPDDDWLVCRLAWLAVTLSILACSVAIAALIPFFAVFQNMLGAMLGAPIVFGGPAWMYFRCCRTAKRKIALGDRLMISFLLCFMFPMCTVLGTWTAISGLVAEWRQTL